MNRFWLITSTTYGTWLPGDERGFVSRVQGDDGTRVVHNELGTPYDRDMPALRKSAHSLLKGPPVLFNEDQATAVRDQFLETIKIRGWDLHATSVMANHFHAVVEAQPEIRSTKILGDLKSYAARALSRRWGKPISGTWWTESGSRRPLNHEAAILNSVIYVVTRQHRPLAVWHAPFYAQLIQDTLSGGRQPPGSDDASDDVLGGLTPPAQGLDDDEVAP